MSANQPMSNKQWQEKQHHNWRYSTKRYWSCHMLQSTVEWNQTTAGQTQIIGVMGSSWQNTEGICQHLKLILHIFQASLDLQRVVQYLHTAGVWIKPHWEGALDTGHVPPGQRYTKRPEKKESKAWGIQRWGHLWALHDRVTAALSETQKPKYLTWLQETSLQLTIKCSPSCSLAHDGISIQCLQWIQCSNTALWKYSTVNKCLACNA